MKLRIALAVCTCLGCGPGASTPAAGAGPAGPSSASEAAKAEAQAKSARLHGAYQQAIYQGIFARGMESVADAMDEMQQLAEQGSSDASLALGVDLAEEGSLLQKQARSLVLIREAADRGHDLAGLLMNAAPGTAPGDEDPQAFTEWLDGPGSPFHFAWSLENGDGMPKDEALAVECYELGAYCGDERSAFNLARLTELGIGREADLALARKLYEHTAKQGLPQGMERFAEFLARGIGGPKDRQTASHWAYRAGVSYSMSFSKRAADPVKTRQCMRRAKALFQGSDKERQSAMPRLVELLAFKQ